MKSLSRKLACLALLSLATAAGARTVSIMGPGDGPTPMIKFIQDIRKGVHAIIDWRPGSRGYTSSAAPQKAPRPRPK